MMEDGQPLPRRFRFKLGTILFAVAILALLLVAIIQQVQIERMRRLMDAQAQQLNAQVQQQDKLTAIIRELRDHLERSK
jgi:cytochrome c-type biogenesis protein CcmH/NrfG